jgi:hypothetical protein
MQLSAQELLDMRRAEAASLDSDEEDVSEGEPSPPPVTSEEEEEEKEQDPALEWTAEYHAVNAPAFVEPTGPQHAARHAESALQFLQLFLTPGLMQQIADWTNAYAQQRGAERGWRTTPAELYAFLGVHIYMGVSRLPQWHMYWSELYQQPFVASVFPRWRFEQLLRYFHVAPPDAVHAPDDVLARVRQLMQSLQHSFAHHYLPSRDLVLDEAMVAYKGRSSIKQYIPSKPHRWGYKVWCLASNGYLVRFEVYEGKELHPSGRGVTYDTVMRMVQPYEGKQHVLYIDSWFTSAKLLDALQQRGTRACGTVQRKRLGGSPVTVAQVAALDRGHWLHRQRGDLSLAVWKDQKAVWVLYNHCSPQETSSLDRWNDAGEREAVGCPKSVHDYFFKARSVDILSQQRYAYPIGRKSRKRWPRLAWWLLDMCIVNAFVLWSIGQRRRTQLDFREQLMHELVKMFGADREAVLVSRGANAAVAMVKSHHSILSHEERDCAVCSHRPAHRVQTNFMCAHCQVHLCLGKCFVTYHS